MMKLDTCEIGDCSAILRTIPDGVFHCCVTSPPYWNLRDYQVDGQIGLEDSPDAFVDKLVDVFREVRRTLRDDGTLWINIGDSYFGDSPVRKAASEAFSAEWDPTQTRGRGGTRRSASRIGSLKPKDLCGIPWRLAFALQDDGWWLRSEIIWAKPNPMPESVMDRPTKSHEQIFLLAKSKDYFYDADAVKERGTSGPSDIRKMVEKKDRIDAKHFHVDPGDIAAANPRSYIGRKRGVGDPSGRNKRSVWTVGSHNYTGAHFATFPPDLIRPCIRAGCPVGGIVLDPFMGSGTVGQVAEEEGRHWFGCELNPDYAALIVKRTAQMGFKLGGQCGD